MKSYVTTILMIIYTINAGSKRNIEEMMISQNYNKVLNSRDTFSKSKLSIHGTSSSFTVEKPDHIHFKYKRQDDNYDNTLELLKFLDCVDVPEPPNDELNKWAPVTFDYDSLKELLEDKQDFKLINDQKIEINDISIKDLKNSFQQLESSVINDSYHSNIELNYTKEEKIMWNTLKIYIKDYIFQKIPYSYRSRFLKRINIIKEACGVFDNHTFNHEKYLSIFDPLEDEEFINEFKKIIVTFDMKSEFNQDICNNFLEEFDSKIYDSNNSKEIRGKLSCQDDNQKIIFFNYEFMKLYKYVASIPELLTFGGLYSSKYYWIIIFIIHLINIFAENVENVQENSVFILCMISKALKCFHQNRFDIFQIPSFELVCDKFNHNLYYFVWEFNNKKRYEIYNRTNKIKKCIPNDERDLKIIILLFIYQTRIFGKYYKIDSEDINLLKKIIAKTINSEDCFGCLCDEYLIILSKIKIKNFKS